MATGDVTIVVQVEGGAAKTATIPSVTRVHAMTWANRAQANSGNPALTDATWSVGIANGAADEVILSAENELKSAAAPSRPTYTAAS